MMATTIKTKNSTTAATAPTGLVQGELAVNITDKKLYVGDASGNSIQIAGAGATNAAGGSNTQVQYNSSGALAGSANFVFDGTNVGIGTASPNIGGYNTALTVNNATSTALPGIELATAGVLGASVFYNGNTNIAYFGGQKASSQTVLISAGSERMRIDSSGKVAIATPSPESNLTVYGTSTAPSATTLSSGTLNIKGSSTLRLLIGTDPASPYGAWLQTTDGAGAGYPINLNPLGGNVGIGTSSPSGKLHVLGSGGTRTITSDTTGYAASLSRSTGGDFYVGINDSAGTAFGSTAYSRAIWGDSAYPMVFGTNSTERMRIDSSGNVMINTTVAAASTGGLNINSTASGSEAVVLALMNRGTANNTTATISFRGLTSTSAENDYGYIKLIESSTTNGSSTGQMAFWTQSSGTLAERMRIDSSGNLLVGTTSGSSKLTVNGAISTSSGSALTSKLTTQAYQTSVSTTATTIATGQANGAIVLVTGYVSGGSNQWTDLVFYAYNTVNVISTINYTGSPAARTYSVSTYDLKVRMASGTYIVDAVELEVIAN